MWKVILVAISLLAVPNLAIAEQQESVAIEMQKVSINQADAETLAELLIGVGPQKAAAIIQYRKQQGPFQSIEDLKNVKGIGETLVQKNRSRLSL